MSDERLKELNSHGKAAWVVMQLVSCEKQLSTPQIACALGISFQGALNIMNSVSVVVPIYQDDCGCWQWLQPVVE